MRCLPAIAVECSEQHPTAACGAAGRRRSIRRWNDRRRGTRRPATACISPTRWWGRVRSTSSSCPTTSATSRPTGSSPSIGPSRRLAEHARLILLDCRGVGASDRGAGLTPTIEARMDDIRVVMDATGSERACLFGIESGAMLCFPFAATHPERTSGAIVFGATASGRWAPDYPWAWKPEGWQPWLDRIDEAWGTPGFVEELADWLCPSLVHDRDFIDSIGHLLRLA